jgi:hypothetical protein
MNEREGVCKPYFIDCLNKEKKAALNFSPECKLFLKFLRKDLTIRK